MITNHGINFWSKFGQNPNQLLKTHLWLLQVLESRKVLEVQSNQVHLGILDLQVVLVVPVILESRKVPEVQSSQVHLGVQVILENLSTNNERLVNITKMSSNDEQNDFDKS